jgi:hypothetical protein
MDRDYFETTKKNLIMIVSLTALIIILALLFGGPKQAKVPKMVINHQLVANEEDIIDSTFEIRQIKKDDKYVNFDIKYPYFFYAGPDFNTQIKDFLETQVEAHSVTSKDAWGARYQTRSEGYDISEFPKNNDEKFYFFSDFEVAQSNSSFISVIVHYGGYSGGAHGYENRVSFAYDIKNKKKIELIDLFAGDTNYLQILSEKSKVYFQELLNIKIKEVFTAEDDEEAVMDYATNYMMMIENGTKPIKENFSVFSFSKDKIIIYFGQYQVGPYSDGAQQLEISR